ncbi:MAG: porphobilinogen synthase [Bacteriovoracia bacterium]
MDRLRRLRQNKLTRELVRKVDLKSSSFIQPLFVVEGLRDRETIPGLPGVFRETPETLLHQVEADIERGVHKFLLFGVPQEKNESPTNFDFAQNQIQKLKQTFRDKVLLFTDVCLCSYTSHGHCGVIERTPNSYTEEHLHNDKTLELLSKAAVEYAQAGSDGVAPSDMMDGRIADIRGSLDKAGFENTLIMSYAAKFHSRFYGPFRNAADSTPKSHGLKDRSTYQIDPTNPQDAWLSASRDANEGADILMVKPGLPYLDILSKLSQRIEKPWAVYEVSGEYAAIELLAREKLISAPHAHSEVWTSFIRAGASTVISYGARFAKDWIRIWEDSQ